MPGHAALHGNRQQYGGSGYAVDWEKGVQSMKDVIVKGENYFKPDLVKFLNKR